MRFVVACLSLWACGRSSSPSTKAIGPAADSAAAGADTATATETEGEDGDGDGVAAGEDCDDADATVFPGAVEVCNGRDDNCDGVVDPPDAWPSATTTHRASLLLSGAPLAGAAWVLEVDPIALGLPAESASRLHVREGGCAGTDHPVQVIPGLAGLLGDGPHTTASPSFTLVLPASVPADVPLVLSVGDEMVAPVATVSAGPSFLQNAHVDVQFDAEHGGLPLVLAPVGGPSTGDLSRGAGNGAYVGDWSSVPANAPAMMSVLVDGPLLGVVEASGVYASVGWRWTWALLGESPVLVLKMHLFADTDLTLDHPGDWSNGVRPFQAIQSAILPVAASIAAPPYDELTTIGTGASLWLRWWSPPAFRPYRPESYDGNLIVFGNDVSAEQGGPRSVGAGTDILAHRRLLIAPYISSRPDSAVDSFLGDHAAHFGLVEERVVP